MISERDPTAAELAKQVRSWRSQCVWDGGLGVLWLLLGIDQFRHEGARDWFVWLYISMTVMAAVGILVHSGRARRAKRELDALLA